MVTISKIHFLSFMNLVGYCCNNDTLETLRYKVLSVISIDAMLCSFLKTLLCLLCVLLYVMVIIWTIDKWLVDNACCCRSVHVSV